MLVHRFHIIYVEVPSGHPGVDDILAEDRYEAFGQWRMQNRDNRKVMIGMTFA